MLYSSRAVAGADDASPREIIKRCIAAANDHKYDEAENYIDPGEIGFLNNNATALPGGLRGLFDFWTNNGTVQTCDVSKEQIRGAVAVAFAHIKYNDGSTENHWNALVKRDGGWKLAFRDVDAKRLLEETVEKNQAQGVMDQFRQEHGIEQWIQPSQLKANPFVFEGKVIAVPLTFMQMISATEGLFEEDVLVTDIPKGTFTERYYVLIGGVAKGTKAIKTPFGGEATVPVIKYLGMVPRFDHIQRALRPHE
jgi:hypothetical protein